MLVLLGDLRHCAQLCLLALPQIELDFDGGHRAQELAAATEPLEPGMTCRRSRADSFKLSRNVYSAIWHGTGTRNWDLAGPIPESDSWFLIPAGIPEFGYSGY